ncbi:MAG TPA: asparaginase [Gemmatimonadales bacterium]|nr:asparaginase [Gemmatimonadales bacterium]
MIHLLATGGTIAMQRSGAAGGNVPALDAAGLLALVGELDAEGGIRVEDWERLPAVHRGPAGLWALRQRVAELLGGREPPAGVVITHGTDTLEEVAYLLARTLPPEVPVVLTGAMRTSSDAEWDGPRNLRDAVRVAASPESRGRGAMVVFGGRILDGRDVAKLNAFAPDAFASPHSRQLGAVSEGGVRFTHGAEPQRALLAPPGLTRSVALVPLQIGDEGALLELARPHFDGVVIEAFGRGNSPPGILPSVHRWLADGKPVVLATRCAYGEVGGEYAFEGGGGQLLRLGVQPAGPRSAALARLELILCLAAGVPYGGVAP